MRPTVLCFSLAYALVAGCAQPHYVAQKSAAKFYAIDTTAAIDSALVRMLAPYKLGVDTSMQVVVGRTDIPLTKAQPECTLGNFIADATLQAARRIDPRVHAAVINYGGIRSAYLAPGPVSTGELYEIMPFDNFLTILEVPGRTLRRLCDGMAYRRGWPVAGLEYTIKGKKATSIRIGGEVLDTNRVYKIALSDYLAGGGDDCDFLKGLRRKNTSVMLRDAMIQYVAALEKKGDPLHPKIENRVQEADAE